MAFEAEIDSVVRGATVVVCVGSVLLGGVGANGRIGDEIAVNMSFLD
jgi:hypothetical protein